MEYTIQITSAYLGLPIRAEQEKRLFEIYDGRERLYELRVPADPDCAFYDYYAYLNVEALRGKTLLLRGEMGEAFYAHIVQTDRPEQPEIVRPLIHFAAERGWINDPNGFVCHDGTFHLFFQYNPVDTVWENMSWGHAETPDLLHFTQKDTAMYPDRYGAIYSGCGLVNERGLLGLPDDALVFCYTAAGGLTKWSEGRAFTQRLACSTDGGRTLKKLPQEAVGVIERESRDPQIFWHEKTQAYVMTLWLQGDEIGFLRSADLQNWELASRVTFPSAFECPNLFCLGDGEKETWVLLVADGTYYTGQFDGYRFEADGTQRRAYLTGQPYAAQICSGTKDRTVLIPWLRTKNEGRLYTGMMGLPRELSLDGADEKLRLLPVREYEASKKEAAVFETSGEEVSWDVSEEAVVEVALELTEASEISAELFGQRFAIQKDVVLFGREKTGLPEEVHELHLLIDRQLVELYANHGRLNACYETDSDELTGRISVKGCCGTVKIYEWRP